MKSKAFDALEVFKKKFNCAQAVFSSHCEDFGMDTETAFKVAGGFGGGMGHIGEVCGAVSGALMLIGLKYGQYKDGDTASKENTYRVVKDFTDAFKKEFGSINCCALLKCDISVPENLDKAREAGIFGEVCPQFVKRAVEMVEQRL